MNMEKLIAYAKNRSNHFDLLSYPKFKGDLFHNTVRGQILFRGHGLTPRKASIWNDYSDYVYLIQSTY